MLLDISEGEGGATFLLHISRLLCMFVDLISCCEISPCLWLDHFSSKSFKFAIHSLSAAVLLLLLNVYT